MNFVAIDFETANHGRDSACSVGLVKVEGGKITEKIVRLIRPPSRAFVFTYIHGLAWGDVAEASDFGGIWPKIEPLFRGAEYLAAHNASFDQGVLSACCRKHKLSPPDLPFRCSMQVARREWGIYPTKLPDVCRHLKIKLNHHEALSDALACAKIMMAAKGIKEEKPNTLLRRKEVERTL